MKFILKRNPKPLIPKTGSSFLTSVICRACFIRVLFFVFPFFIISAFLWKGAGGEAFAQQCNIIYVTPNGAGSGTGSQGNPASLPYAFTLASATNNQLWLAIGNYTISNELPMISGITLEGGFDPANNWRKTNAQQTVIVRDASNMDAGPNRIVAIDCNGISNFSIHDITVITSDASTGTSTSTYGVHISNSSSYILSRLTITAGNARDGVDGVAGAPGSPGANGQPGEQGDEDGPDYTGGGLGGFGSYPGSNAGGNGGTGGARGSGGCFGGGNAPDGSPGQTGLGTGGGAGGSAGQGNCGLALSFGCDQGPASVGANGADGIDGADGADGLNGTPVFGAYFIPGDGQTGAQGDHGGGGGGGGGGGSQGCLIECFGINTNGAGPGGSGGGEGGQGGFGASGGTGGGGSFGVYIDANGSGTYLKDCFSTSGLQGIGGLGGIPGGNGGGSSGGAAGVQGCDIGTGGAGGDGGKGGKGGNGGTGAPGMSLPLYEDPNTPAIAQSDMKATVEPAVYLQNTGCTFHDIKYNTNATGIVQWFFDGGSIPLSGTGDSVKTQYSNPGRHSITLVVDGVPYMFTDFTGIFKDGAPFLPTITGPDTVCPGSPGNFSASFPSPFTVINYDWKLYKPGSSVPDQETNTATFSYIFPDTNSIDYRGTYMITLQTESQCCGWSKMDTFYVNVVQYLTADVFVSASAASICDGESAIFFAVPVNGGNNPAYDWLVDGVSTGISSNSYSYSLPYSSYSTGDSIITCTMTSSYPCPLNSPATSIPFNITVFSLPAATCSTTGAFLGANTAFSAVPSGGIPAYYYNWDFGDGGIDTAAFPAHLYGGTGIFSYSVSVTDANGCTGVCNNTVDISIAPYVSADFMFSSTVTCGNTVVNFTDNTIGLGPGSTPTWLWDFGDGNTDTVQSPSHTYTSPGNYSVTLTAGNGVFADSYLAANIISVKAVPVASISYITDTVCYPLSANFFNASSGVDSWLWDFGDGIFATIPNPSHTYSTPGTFIVTLIVSSKDTCSDTATAILYNIPAPVAAFTLSDTVFCSVDQLIITDNSDSAVSWNWAFGDGTFDTVSSPAAHQYFFSGDYWIYLSVENGNGCMDDSMARITVLPTPVAGFSTNEDSICNNEFISVYNESSTDVIAWNWDFGDGSTDSVLYPLNHNYYTSPAYPAVYPITLITKNSSGCLDTVKKNVTVFLTPTADLSLSDNLICSGESVSFTNNSLDASVWNWSFGNGDSDTAQSPPSQQYTNSGIFDVYLLAENPIGGCTDDTLITGAVEVKAQPNALFRPDTIEIKFPDNDIDLVNLSSNSDGTPITNWIWDFGNGILDSGNYNATAVYPDSGTFTITLFTIVDGLCSDTDSVEIHVIDLEAIYFSNSFTPNGDGINDVFYVYGNNMPEFKLYIFDRWGDNIFETSDMSLAAEGKFGGWDGKVKGVKVPDGIYPIRVDYKLKSTKNKVFSRTGSIRVLGKK